MRGRVRAARDPLPVLRADTQTLAAVLMSVLDGFDRVVVDWHLGVDAVALQEVLELVQVVV